MMYPLVQELPTPRSGWRWQGRAGSWASVSRPTTSGGLAPSAREAEQEVLIGVLRELHDEDPEAGYRGLSDDLADRGYVCSERRMWRLCHVAGIRSVIHDREKRGPGSPGAAVHDDLLAYKDDHGVTRHRISADRANQVWLTDIAEHHTREGKLYLCAVKDVFSNRIVGYSIDRRMKAQLAVDALTMAIAHRANPVGVIVHSDRGSQFRSRRYRRVLEERAAWLDGARRGVWRQRSDGIVLLAAAEERPRPPNLGRAPATQAGDGVVDRGKVPPQAAPTPAGETVSRVKLSGRPVMSA